ncbi:vacuoleless1 [Actinidia rufa]|uniref:Vacuoleless1 n=1 Tax=Actinidia rufa TaxID=165716 RepID=A0A7J0G418_9ERIC|nr:vacuoleless1 [Actinidia rufa]
MDHERKHICQTVSSPIFYDSMASILSKNNALDENLRLIRSSLPEAVEACIDAAGHEFDVSRQRTLLRAASYGQAFCRKFRSPPCDVKRVEEGWSIEYDQECVDKGGERNFLTISRKIINTCFYMNLTFVVVDFGSHFQRDRFQEMCKTLRVLNAVRNHDIGIPLSIQQYKLLTPSILVGRLINAHRHALAVRISEYLGMNQVSTSFMSSSDLGRNLLIVVAGSSEVFVSKFCFSLGIVKLRAPREGMTVVVRVGGCCGVVSDGNGGGGSGVAAGGSEVSGGRECSGEDHTSFTPTEPVDIMPQPLHPGSPDHEATAPSPPLLPTRRGGEEANQGRSDCQSLGKIELQSSPRFLILIVKTSYEVVIMHWACAKIAASLAIPDDALLEILLEKLRICKGISYAAVAAHADKSGRRKLTAMLVEHEPRSSKQVPLLLSIGEEDTALTKATECGDTDLVYLVLFHIWQKRPALELFGMIQARPLARDLFISYGRCYKHEFLKDFFLSTGQLQDVSFLLWKESWELSKNPMASKGSPLQGPRIKLIEKAQSLFAETKEHAFESKAAEEHAKLLRIQHELEVTTKQAIFVDSSISDTIRTCIVLGNHRAAMKVRTEFKVSEKRWYWLKVFALATIRDWDALEKFSKEKRPPIGKLSNLLNLSEEIS